MRNLPRLFTLPPLLCLLLIPAFLPNAASAQDLEARYRAGGAALQQGNALQAIEILDTVAAERQDYRDVQMLLGQSCLMAGLNRRAKNHFERAFETQPANGQAAFLLGFTLYQEARYFEAAEALQKAQGLSPSNPLPAMYRGLALLRLGDAQGARQGIESALRLAPKDPIALAARAELELAEGNFAAAERSIRSVLGSTPQGDDAHFLLARILLESGRAAEAAQEIHPLVQKSSDTRSDVLYLLAQAQLRSGQSRAGRQTMERFKEVKARESRLRLLETEVSTAPGDVEARLELTGLLLDFRQVQAARAHLATLQRQAPRDARVRALFERWQRSGGEAR